MAIKFIEFKKQWLDGHSNKELFAEAIFDKTYLREIIYHDHITPIPKFKEYIESGRFINDFRRNKVFLEYPSKSGKGGYRLIAEEIKAPERLLEDVEQALKDAVNYKYTDRESANALQRCRDILSHL
jgi:hypothetical protein